MNVYRVQYYLITGRTVESIRGQEFQQRHGVEKSAYVVAPSPEEAGAFIAGKNDCEILGVLVHVQNVEVATSADSVGVLTAPAPETPPAPQLVTVEPPAVEPAAQEKEA